MKRVKFRKDKRYLMPDVRPLLEREKKINTRKGMKRIKKTGYIDLTEYKEQLIFPEYE